MSDELERKKAAGLSRAFDCCAACNNSVPGPVKKKIGHDYYHVGKGYYYCKRLNASVNKFNICNFFEASNFPHPDPLADRTEDEISSHEEAKERVYLSLEDKNCNKQKFQYRLAHRCCATCVRSKVIFYNSTHVECDLVGFTSLHSLCNAYSRKENL